MAGLMDLYTIGFTKKTAEEFFGLLKKNRVRVLIDTRLNNKSQLAGFTKEDDLRFFLKEICSIEYKHIPLFAPTEDILKKYQAKRMTWEQYEKEYNALLVERQVKDKISPAELDRACLLCSEHSPTQCHRRLLAEYLVSYYPEIKVIHI